MPPLLAPVEIHFCGYTGLNAWTIAWWSVAACQMSRSDQLAGSGREGVKKRYSTEIWLPSMIAVGSDLNAYSGTLYPVVCSTIGRSVDLCSSDSRCEKVPLLG